MDNLLMANPDPTVVERVERRAEPPPTAEPAPPLTFAVKNLSIWYGQKRAISDVTLDIASNAVTAIIGPSGCGKSTFIRCLNRMHELVPKAKTSGRVILDGSDIYAKGVDPVTIRRRVGMVFQKPNPFPTMSVYDNVAAGLKLNGESNHAVLDRAVQQSLE